MRKAVEGEISGVVHAEEYISVRLRTVPVWHACAASTIAQLFNNQ